MPPMMDSPTIRIKRFLALVLAGCMIALQGCGGPKIVKVRGKLTEKGEPFVRKAGSLITLHFIPSAGGNTYSAKVQGEAGTYVAEMPPGSYKVMYLSMKGMTKDSMLPNPEGKPKKASSPYREIKSGLDIKTDTTLDLETSP